jgi:hypothetical protein
MGQPITLYAKDGREITVYGAAQRQVEIDTGALTENPFKSAQPLQDDFPAAAALRAGGYTSAEAIAAASDDGLLSVRGIGAETLKEIRNAIKAARPAETPPAAPKSAKGKAK